MFYPLVSSHAYVWSGDDVTSDGEILPRQRTYHQGATKASQ